MAESEAHLLEEPIRIILNKAFLQEFIPYSDVCSTIVDEHQKQQTRLGSAQK